MTARVIVALDVMSASEALSLVARLGAACDFVKVGSALFTAAGPEIVDRLRARGCDVFLDLKFHDIPNTVRDASLAAARSGARLLTVHASGGEAMIAAAVDGAHRAATGRVCSVLAVTVLTSLDASQLGTAWGRVVTDVPAEVLRLSGIARDAGADGVVCSGQEAAAVRERYGDALALLVPGVRLAGGAVHDQKRVVTPAQAVAAGARYLVVGRAVTQAADPAVALSRVRAEL
ncbi:MAG TPA: orotidine-5'-phosphate decarboxylase [Gemmatimonadaceae bacterium]|jgi:orotidine-5'-phosphate decarboxylase|nr:orotidine-5'-phosphate decarboxylase [Gemmatimonadaceae bacterium]